MMDVSVSAGEVVVWLVIVLLIIVIAREIRR